MWKHPNTDDKRKGKMSKKMQFFLKKSKIAHLQNEKFGL